MPTYNYKCNTCGAEFEYQQRMSDNALQNCPVEVCQSEEKGKGIVARTFSKNIGLVFKGSGFYQTDYTSKPKSDSAIESNVSCGCNGGSCQTKASA